MDIPVEVLIIESRHPAREIIMLAFARKGTDVHVYTTDKEEDAIAVLSQRTLPCVVLIGDVEPPLLEKLLRHVKEAQGPLRRVPVVCWVRSVADVQSSYDLGANSCLSMPDDPQKLADMMTDIAQYWIRYNIFYNQDAQRGEFEVP